MKTRTVFALCVGVLICTRCVAATQETPSATTSAEALTPAATQVRPEPTVLPTATPTPVPVEPERVPAYRPELLVSIPWGEEDDEMAPVVCEAAYGDILPGSDSNLQVIFRQGGRFYVDSASRVYALEAAFGCYAEEDPREYILYEFSTEGVLTRRLDLRAGDEVRRRYTVEGFAVEGESAYILDRFYDGDQPSAYLSRLRRIDLNEGVALWTWSIGMESSMDDPGQLVVASDGSPYLVSNTGTVLEIDKAGGQTTRSIDLSITLSLPIAYWAPSGLLHVGGSACDLDSAVCEGTGSQFLEGEHFFGVDGNGNVYACDWWGDTVVRLLTGEESPSYPAGNAVVDADGRGILISGWDARQKTLTIWNWNMQGEYIGGIVLDVPIEDYVSSQDYAVLVHVDEDGFYIDDHKALYRYSFSGEMETREPYSDPEESDRYDIIWHNASEALFPIGSLAGGCDDARVDAEGRFYFPIVDPEGFKVLRLTPLPDPGE